MISSSGPELEPEQLQAHNQTKGQMRNPCAKSTTLGTCAAGTTTGVGAHAGGIARAAPVKTTLAGADVAEPAYWGVHSPPPFLGTPPGIPRIRLAPTNTFCQAQAHVVCSRPCHNRPQVGSVKKCSARQNRVPENHLPGLMSGNWKRARSRDCDSARPNGRRPGPDSITQPGAPLKCLALPPRDLNRPEMFL
jgi:hypothetical protein